MKIFLHIGLHKTGTKFLQYKVFKNIKNKNFLYNPKYLTQLIIDLMKSNKKDSSKVNDYIIKELKDLKKKKINKIFISKEIMAGDCFRFYPNSNYLHLRLKKIFPNAELIICLRNQFNWIMSCYKETVYAHHYQSIYEYLKLKKTRNNFIKINFKNLDYEKYIKSTRKIFGKGKVHILFHEELKNNKKLFLKKIAKILGLRNLNVTNDKDNIPNRGYSALAIKILIIRYKIFKFLNIHKLIHRPIIMMGFKSIPSGFEDMSVLPKKYWSNYFLRDNEEVRSSRYPNNLTLKEKFLIFFTLKNFLKNFLDKKIYLDWRIIDKKHEELIKKYYYKKNIRLEKYLEQKLDKKFLQ